MEPSVQSLSRGRLFATPWIAKGLLKIDELLKVGPNQTGMVPIGKGGEARQLSLDE